MTDITFLGDTPFERVKSLMERLRHPEQGCPWDKEQNFATIAPYTIEEAYEVSEAINQNNMTSLKEELGDLLFQVIFHSRLAEEASEFSVEDVFDTLVTKMVRRHPHVFGDGDDRTASEQTIAWEALKAEERASKSTGKTSVLDGVALALPELMRAQKLQKRASRVGFDWPNTDGVIDKIKEEADELSVAASTLTEDAIEDEMGDLLFAVTNLSRHLGVDAEIALRRTNEKFTKRFHYIETAAEEAGLDLSEMNLETMDVLWTKAKEVD